MSCCYPSSQFGSGLCRLLMKCLCFVCWGLKELTTCWLLPKCPFRLGLLLPLVLPGLQSCELDSSGGARCKQPRFLEDQASVWKSGLQTGLRQKSRETGDVPNSQTLRKMSSQNGPKHKQSTPDMQYLLQPPSSLPSVSPLPCLSGTVLSCPADTYLSPLHPTWGTMVLHAVT